MDESTNHIGTLLKTDEKKARLEAARALEAKRDLLGVENIESNKPALSKMRENIDLPEGVTLKNVNALYRSIRKFGTDTTKWKLPAFNVKQPEIEVDEKPSLALTSREKRTRATTGTIDGKFVYRPVKEWAARLDENPEKWGKEPSGKPRSLDNFVKWLNRSFAQSQRKATAKTKKQRWAGETHAGHATSAKEGGTDSPSNVASQPARHKIAGLIGNLDISGKSLHSLKDLQDAGIDGGTLEGAFQEYMNEGEKNIWSIKDIGEEGHSKVVHSEEKPQATEIEARRAAETRKVNLEMNKRNIESSKVKAKRLFTGVREASRIAGQSNNPVANIGGDVVGAIMDGVSFIQDPSLENRVDLILSSGQALTSLGALGLSALPILGARPGAFMLMKVGDNLAKAEKIWNINRTGYSAVKKQKNKPEILSSDHVGKLLKSNKIKTK